MPHRIVVADKDPRSREAVTRFLGDQDNEFVTVASSGELKDAIKRHRPDLIILNAVLEDAPGWRIVKKIKDSKDYGGVPILLMTGDPGGPPPGKVQTTGADGYLAKPIEGAALKNAVGSLLGLPGEGELDIDEEITLHFDEEDEEVTVGRAARGRGVAPDDIPSPVGDTVEIDTGGMASELDAETIQSTPSEYEDTVRLNLDDMDLEDTDEEFATTEPTIELVTDIAVDLDSGTEELDISGDRVTGEISLDSPEVAGASDEALPDFSSDVDSAQKASQRAKDSVTVEMDVDDLDLGLEVTGEEEEIVAETSIGPDSTDLEKLLEVQEPSLVLTSEELQLEDDSLVRDVGAEAAAGELDVIDLEEDTEISELEAEELEPIQVASEVMDMGDVEETEQVPDEDMAQLAQENLEEAEFDDTVDVTLEEGPTVEIDTAGLGAEEISLEDVSDEAIATEEFFGEELPTAEFPTEVFPSDRTEDLSLEQEISFEEPEGGEDYFAKGELPSEEAPRAAAGPAEPLTAEPEEEEPVLEVTEDILLDEITFEEEEKRAPESAAAAGPLKAPEEPVAAFEPEPAREAGRREPFLTEELPEVTVAAASTREAFPSLDQMKDVFSAVLAQKLQESALPASQFAAAPGEALRESLPPREDFRQAFTGAVESALPPKDELMERLLERVAVALPSRDEILDRVDAMIVKSLPSEEVIAQKVDEAIQKAIPGTETVMDRIEEALRAVPTETEVQQRFEGAFKGFPTTETLLARLDEHVKAVMPDRAGFETALRNMFQARIEHALGMANIKAAIESAIPSGDDLLADLKQALPEKELFRETLAQSLAHAIQDALPEKIWLESLSRGLFDEKTKGVLPSKEEVGSLLREEIRARLLEIVEKVVKQEIARIAADLES
ncbi:MAG: response regulator [Thermodesulfobacteriota bacterium]